MFNVAHVNYYYESVKREVFFFYPANGVNEWNYKYELWKRGLFRNYLSGEIKRSINLFLFISGIKSIHLIPPKL